MISALLNIPASDKEWDIWSWHHRLSHDVIAQAIKAQKKITLTDYTLDPIPQSDIISWLQRNEQTHIEMDAAIGTQSYDLQDVNLKDDKQKQAWIYLHYLEHQTAELTLGVGS